MKGRFYLIKIKGDVYCVKRKTDHRYYCNNGNYFDNDCVGYYENWNEFLDDCEDMDIDYNLIFRFDLEDIGDFDEYEIPLEELETYLRLKIYIIGQRKGIFRVVIIKNIKEENFESINNYLRRHKDYLKELWKEID